MSSPASRPAHHRAAFARTSVWLIVLAVLAVQTLGLLHGVAHAWRSGIDVASAPCAIAAPFAPGAASRAANPAHSPSGLDAMFGAGGGHDCKAFDQASHADLIGMVAPVFVAAAAPPEPPPIAIAWHAAAQRRGFLARGPPVAS